MVIAIKLDELSKLLQFAIAKYIYFLLWLRYESINTHLSFADNAYFLFTIFCSFDLMNKNKLLQTFYTEHVQEAFKWVCGAT